MTDIYEACKNALKKEMERRRPGDEPIRVRCKALTAEEAIGNPDHDDYPIIKGKEVMVEATFKGARGQAFSDHYENADYSIEDLVGLKLDSNRQRASFIAGLNAVYRYFGLCDKTVHCKDAEPKECAGYIQEKIGETKNVLLVGHQPRFLEAIAARYPLRALDMDQDNIGKTFGGVKIESPKMTEDAIDWCDLIFATGSTIVNGTIVNLLNKGKPAVFYGVTISAAARIIGLDTFCRCGH